MRRVLWGLVAVLAILSAGASSSAPDSDKTAATDTFQPKSAWTGQESGGGQFPRDKANHAQRPVTIHVLKREGDAVQFDYWVRHHGGKHGVRLEGKLHDGALKAQATKILEGQPWEEKILDTVWEGRLNEKSLTLKRKDSTNQVITSEVTLEEPQ